MINPQLFTLHFAGGSCYSFHFMNSDLTDFDIIAIELPGRGKRMTQPLLRGFEQAAHDIFQQIITQLSGSPFILYGHSMGAILGLKVVHMLELYGKSPSGLVFTGSAGPRVLSYKNTAFLDTQDLKMKLITLGGMTVDGRLCDHANAPLQALHSCVHG